jgi:DNA-binding PadR family transcriptional regulator
MRWLVPAGAASIDIFNYIVVKSQVGADDVGHLGELEQLILFAVAALGDEAYGGAIRAHIEERTGRIVSSGAIITTLGRLADRRLVLGRVGTPTPGRAGRPRKYYALTPAGARDLRESYTTIRSMAGGLLPRLDALAEKKR